MKDSRELPEEKRTSGRREQNADACPALAETGSAQRGDGAAAVASGLAPGRRRSCTGPVLTYETGNVPLTAPLVTCRSGP